VGSKRNTLGIADCQLRMRKHSGASHSNSKWNNRSTEDDANIIRFMMENRKKYNLSCGDIADHKPNSKSKGKESKCKKKSVTNKKNNKTDSKKAIKKIIVDNEGKRYKQLCLANKSKGNTSVANINLNATKAKKKGKENKENRKKKSRSKSKHQQKHGKSSKMFVLPKEDSDGERELREHEHEYPINKYFNSKKKHRNLLNIRVGFDSSHNFISSEDSSLRGARKSSSNEFSWDFPKHNFGAPPFE
jgi:hypothetical protein